MRITILDLSCVFRNMSRRLRPSTTISCLLWKLAHWIALDRAVASGFGALWHTSRLGWHGKLGHAQNVSKCCCPFAASLLPLCLVLPQIAVSPRQWCSTVIFRRGSFSYFICFRCWTLVLPCFCLGYEGKSGMFVLNGSLNTALADSASSCGLSWEKAPGIPGYPRNKPTQTDESIYIYWYQIWIFKKNR